MKRVAFLRLLFLLGIVTVVNLSSYREAWAETLVEWTLQGRIVLAFRVNEAEVQRWVPAPWQVAPVGAGPSKDANFLVLFVDRLLSQDAEGKPVAGATNRAIVFVIPAKNPQTGEAGPLVVRVYQSNPSEVPGFYKTAVQAAVRREQMVKGDSLEPGVATDLWDVQDSSGGTLALRIQYQRGTPSRVKGEVKPRSGTEPAVWRIYRFEQGVDVVKSIPASIDRVQSYQFRVAMPELSKLFDGSEQLVSITALPWYTRQTFLP